MGGWGWLPKRKALESRDEMRIYNTGAEMRVLVAGRSCELGKLVLKKANGWVNRKAIITELLRGMARERK